MISIIIPVYNEENIIKQTLANLPYREDIEVIVVDGESSDKTVEFAQQYPIKLIQCRKNRAVQMNKGAEASHGDILLFLHADCSLGEGSLEEIQDYLINGYIGGCLTQKINSKNLIYRFIEFSGNIRAKLFRIFYGDQAIFVRRDIFLRLNGFDDVPLFEDVLFSKKMKEIDKTKILNKKVFVSNRRWQKNGIIKTTLIYWLLSLGFSLGIPFDTLKKIYLDTR